MRKLEVRRLGVVPYADALDQQRALVDDRRLDRIPDTLLLLQHPHVLTVGVRRSGGRSNILATPDRLEQLGVEVFEAGRGGDVTYHGPGQLVGYPIVDLRPDRQDVHRYVRDLEEVMIRVCADFAVYAQRLPGLTGAWVPTERGPEKIAAIGVRISRWITSHGFALNVATDLDFFRLIVPCGIAEHGVTSLQQLTDIAPTLDAVADRTIAHFCDVFARSDARSGGTQSVAALSPPSTM
jgi:lipoyl(octanoyl) transferase